VAMDHSYIEEHAIIDRYVAGKLSSVECARFEEHFVDCPACRRQLNIAGEFKQMLESVALEDRKIVPGPL